MNDDSGVPAPVSSEPRSHPLGISVVRLGCAQAVDWDRPLSEPLFLWYDQCQYFSADAAARHRKGHLPGRFNRASHYGVNVRYDVENVHKRAAAAAGDSKRRLTGKALLRN